MASSSDILIEKSPQYAGGATSLRLKRAKEQCFHLLAQQLKKYIFKVMFQFFPFVSLVEKSDQSETQRQGNESNKSKHEINCLCL